MQPKLYRDTKAISQSSLKEVARSPRKFEAMYLLGTMEWKQSDAMDLGSLVDMMLLTPKEVEYFRHGGLLHYVLRQLAAKKAA